MRRIACLLLALILCLGMAMAVSADEFVPSIGYKEEPKIPVPPVIIDEDGKKELDGPCLVITPVSEALKVKEEDRTDYEQLLVDVYKQLVDGSMTIPFNDDKERVIRDLIDAPLVCGDYHDHVEQLKKPGVLIEITFDIGIGKNTGVDVMVYLDGKWVPADKVVNNGDGTVTCQFEDICPIAFLVEVGSGNPPAQTGDTAGTTLILWIALMAASLAALIVLLVVRKKGSNR